MVSTSRLIEDSDGVSTTVVVEIDDVYLMAADDKAG